MGSPVSASAPEDHSCVQAFLQSEVAADLLEASTEPSRIFWKQHFQSDTAKWEDFQRIFCENFPISPAKRHNHTEPLKSVVADLLGARYDQPESRVQAKLFERLVRHFGPLDNQLWKRVYDLATRNWFYGSLCTPCAEKHLLRELPGTFLIRFSSSTPGAWTLSRVKKATEEDVLSMTRANPKSGISLGECLLVHERHAGNIESVLQLFIERNDLQKPYRTQTRYSNRFPRIESLFDNRFPRIESCFYFTAQPYLAKTDFNALD